MYTVCAHSVAQLCPTLCDPMDCSPAGLLSMGFPRQEYWIGLPFPPPGNLPNSGIEPLLCFLHWQVDSFPTVPPGHVLSRGPLSVPHGL